MVKKNKKTISRDVQYKIISRAPSIKYIGDSREDRPSLINITDSN
jgi:hypothetical protein